MPCSVFENDKTVKDWKASSSVAYFEPCFREVMEEYTKRSNVMIQMNPAKIEIYRSKRTVFYKEEINITARKYGIGPRPFSFSVHEIKVMIEIRYAANVAPKSDLIQLGSAHELERRLNRALDVWLFTLGALVPAQNGVVFTP